MEPEADNNMEGREVDLSQIPSTRHTTLIIYQEARAHAESGRDTALAYIRPNSNVTTKLRHMGLQVSSRRLTEEQAEAVGMRCSSRGPVEVFVRYTPALEGGRVEAPVTAAPKPRAKKKAAKKSAKK